MVSRLFERAFPSRASIQTWMIMTFVFFVGTAVLAVSLYIAFVLRNEVQIAYRQTMAQQTSWVAAFIEDADPGQDRLEVIQAVSRFGELRVTVIQPDSTVIDVENGVLLAAGEPDLGPELNFHSEVAEIRFSERSVRGQTYYYSAVRNPASGMTVRVGRPQLLLFALVRRMQLTLIVAMAMALLLAIFGSWIAAEQVTRPLQSIRNSAWSISEGHLDKEIHVDSRAAEFQDLAKSLNRMSDTFKEKIDELERLARLQNEFIGNVSHEVRNPIFAVGGYLEALASGGLSDERRRFYAEKGLANLERLNNLFNDLIEIARLEYREDLIKTSVFDLRDLVWDVYELLASKAAEKNIELEIDTNSTFVRADERRMRQVLINLIDNAIAYSDTGKVECRYNRRGQKVRIQIRDTGKGIPAEHLERVFERFHRVDPDRSRKSGGSGLGLSIVKQILAAHGETISVESEPGSGTRFWFDLPWEPGPGSQGQEAA